MSNTTEKIRIIGGPDPLQTAVMLNGKELRGVVSVRFEASINSPRELNRVILEMIPDEIEIDGYAEIISEAPADAS